MKMRFTKDAELERIEEDKVSWELFSGTSVAKALRTARDLGWKDKKVQVRVERIGDDMLKYYVEPFEKDCSCPHMLKYSDWFD